MHRPALALLLTLTLALLAGCASPTRRVTAEVQTLATVATAPQQWQGARYRFERLPAQQTLAAQPHIEALAEAALARAGLVRDDANARLSVLASAAVQPMMADAAHGAWPAALTVGLGASIGRGRVGVDIGSGGGIAGLAGPTPTYWREVVLVLRELRSGQLLFDVRARGDSPWTDHDRVLGLMFDAALQGYPHLPPGVRRVSLDVPR